MAEDNTADSQLKSPAFKLSAYLEAPVSVASLAVFRICFSVAMIALVIAYFHEGWVDILSSSFHFTFIPGVVPFHGKWLYAHLCVIAIFAAMVGIGFYYRTACVLLFLSYSWIFLSEKSIYQNHTYLVCLLSLLFSVVDAHRLFSVDAHRLKLAAMVPRWQVDVFKFQFLIVYFYSGFAKLNTDWLQGYPQTAWIADRAAHPLVGPLLGPILSSLFLQPWFVNLVTYGGIAIDLTAGFLLWWQPTFLPTAIVLCIFHLLNSSLFSIDIFPFFMIATLGVFAREDWPLKFARRFKIFSSPAVAPSDRLEKTSPVLICFVWLYIAFQVLVPLRRFLYPGDTSWTEQGQRFAWRMMLRDKSCKAFKMIFVNPQTGMNGVIEPEYSMTPLQVQNMQVIPDMILQYSHAVAAGLQGDLGFRPIVRVQSLVSLNGRPAQDLIDRKVDLASTPVSFWPAKWILPLNDSRGGPLTHTDVRTGK